MADINSYLAKGSGIDLIGSLSNAQKLQAQQNKLNQEPKRARLLDLQQQSEEQRINANEQAQIDRLEQKDKAALAEKMDQIAVIAGKTKNKEELTQLLQSFGLTPDKEILDPNMPFEQALTRVSSKSKAYRDAALKGINNNGSRQSPSSVQEYNFFKELNPEEQQTFLNIKRAKPNVKVIDKNDEVVVVDAVTSEVIKSFKKSLNPKDQPSNIQEIESAKAQAKQEAELIKTKPKARASLVSFRSKLKLVKSKVEEAKNLVGPFTTGTGVIFANLPGTKAKRLKGVIDTIKANLGFNELQEMRNNSKSGGALGSVSERETELLTAVKQALDQAQSGEDVMDALNMLDGEIDGMGQRVIDAFQEEYNPKAQSKTVQKFVLPNGTTVERLD